MLGRVVTGDEDKMNINAFVVGWLACEETIQLVPCIRWMSAVVVLDFDMSLKLL